MTQHTLAQFVLERNIRQSPRRSPLRTLHTSGSDGLLSSPMSPDEEIIKRRGQIRTSPRKRAFQTSTPAITEIDLTDTSLDTSTSTTGTRTPTRKSAADGVRKRLMLSTSYVSSDPEDSPSSKPAPAAKKRKTNKKSGNLPISTRLCALSSEQLAELIEKLVTNHPEIRDEVEKSIPKPDIENLIENLEYFKKNIFKSLPYTRWGSSRDAFCFRRVKTHVESFKRTCINQGKQLLEAGSWEASMEYILEAWDVINQTPDWENIAHNKSKEMCFRTLATQFKKSLKESTLSKESYEDLKERIENAVEMNNELQPCLEMVAKKMQKIK